MASSVEFLSSATSSKSYGVKPPSSLNVDQQGRKLTLCDLLKQKCLGEEARPSAGMCLIAFAIPLLIPGITLTAVAFNDETGFAKYSVLHVLGIVMLIVSFLLMVAGVLLNIRFTSKIGPDESLHIVSTHEQVHSTLARHEKSSDFNILELVSSNLPPGNFMVEESAHSIAGPAKITGKSAAGKQFSYSSSDPDKYSSSCDSLDSDDYSSGSYIISEEMEAPRSVAHQCPVDEETTEACQPEQGNKKKLLVRHIEQSVNETKHIKSNNFFEDSMERGTSIQATSAGSRTSQDSHSYQQDVIVPSSQTSAQVMMQSPGQRGRSPEVSSPGSRQRLKALSSDMLAQNLQAQSSSSLSSSSSSSSGDMSSASSSSVFSFEKDVTFQQQTSHTFTSDSDTDFFDNEAFSEAQALGKHAWLTNCSGFMAQSEPVVKKLPTRAKSMHVSYSHVTAGMMTVSLDQTMTPSKNNDSQCVLPVDIPEPAAAHLQGPATSSTCKYLSLLTSPKTALTNEDRPSQVYVLDKDEHETGLCNTSCPSINESNGSVVPTGQASVLVADKGRKNGKSSKISLSRLDKTVRFSFENTLSPAVQ